jgi:isopenicillin N synthase-like dioxygenase
MEPPPSYAPLLPDLSYATSALRDKGCFRVPLSPSCSSLTKSVFRLFRDFDAQPVSVKQRHALTPDDDGLGLNNGWHGEGGLGNYNARRSGYIFQGSEPIWNMMDNVSNYEQKAQGQGERFVEVHEAWRAAVLDLASEVARALARGLELGGDLEGHLDSGGALDCLAAHQFHVKRCHYGDGDDNDGDSVDPPESELLLASHIDPSVFSIIIHDVDGNGLEFFDNATREYKDVGEVGPAFATIIAGQLLQKITRDEIKGIKHRVVATPRTEATPPGPRLRLAATFFFAPKLDARLQPLDKLGAKDKPALTHREWKQRAYRRYYAKSAGAAESGAAEKK